MGYGEGYSTPPLRGLCLDVAFLIILLIDIRPTASKNGYVSPPPVRAEN